MSTAAVPFQMLPPRVVERGSKFFKGSAKLASAFYPQLTLELKRAGKDISGEKYLAMCLFNDTFLFVALTVLFILFSPAAGGSGQSILAPIVVIFIVVSFSFFSQMVYPSTIAAKNQKDIEKNLVSALKTIHVQIISGVSLFGALNTVARNDYGLISTKFREVIAQINTGKKQDIALEEMIAVSSSKLFKRAIWQIINGMKTGADTQKVLKDTIHSLNEEQIIQVQQYGSKLTPLTMFYMIIVVIVPTLSMTFLLLLGSFLSLSDIGLKAIFFGVLIFIGFIQYLFIGIIRSKRPALLGDD